MPKNRMFVFFNCLVTPVLIAMEEDENKFGLRHRSNSTIEQRIVETRKLDPVSLTPLMGSGFDKINKEEVSKHDNFWECYQKKELTRSEEIGRCCCGWVCVGCCCLYFYGLCKCHNFMEGCSGNEWVDPINGRNCVDATFQDMFTALYHNLVNR